MSGSSEAAARSVAERFEQLYGAAPDGVWTAPGRVNLIGEHTDYNDGFVMPFALPHSAVAAVSRRDDGVLRLHSADVDGPVAELRVDALAPGSDKRWTAYPAGVVWALREAGHAVTGADVHLASTVPSGAGLSSSAALEVVVALALNDLFGLDLRGRQLARLCQRAENVYVGAPVGIMDQTASACCEAGHALFLDTRDLSRRQIPFDPAAEGMRLLVVDTQVKHSHSEGEYGKRRAGLREGRGPAGRGRAAGTCGTGNWTRRWRGWATRRRSAAWSGTSSRRTSGSNGSSRSWSRATPGPSAPVLAEGHASLRDDFRVSCPGARPGRRHGAGRGRAGRPHDRAAASAARPSSSSRRPTSRRSPRRWRRRSRRPGFTAPRVFEAVPSAGARRVR
ncbi:hypothetical protein GCM10019016_063220 [Streptomyces prasinosporus]|uniref:Galactokinase n=1 Tax=Streptomyces prasinosporus TaxID=68256 RepID=A0ABP6TV24_9ACTN